MRTLLTSLIRGTSSMGRSFRRRKAITLGFEHLDSRRLLAADLGEPASDVTAYVADASAGESTAVVATPMAMAINEETAAIGLATASAATMGPEAGNAADVEGSHSDQSVPADLLLWGGVSGGSDSGQVTMQSGDEGYGLYPPEISDFTAAESEGWWIFTGEVHDDGSVVGLEVRFGGLLEGQSTYVKEDGTFEFVYRFAPGTIGYVSAIVTDLDGLDSAPVEAFVG